MTIKLNKQKEIVLVPKFMRDNEFEEMQGQHFEYEGMSFYLIKSNTGSYCITEKLTKKFMVSWRKTRKQTFEEFEKFMSQHLEKVKDHINKLEIATAI